MSSEKVGAYGNKASEASFRRKWDKEEYTAKAAAQDAEHAEQAKAAQEALAKGKKPRYRKDDLPKPTRALEARTADLDIEKNLNKTVLVSNVGGKGAGQPGFYCELCHRTLKDSIAYLDHVNGRSHLARLGQTTQVRRSTLQEVRDRIAALRDSSSARVNSKTYDFAQRLQEIREQEEARRKEKKEAKKRKRGAESDEKAAGGGKVGKVTVEGTKGAFGNAQEIRKAEQEAESMEMMMGFGGFGGGVKAKR